MTTRILGLIQRQVKIETGQSHTGTAELGEEVVVLAYGTVDAETNNVVFSEAAAEGLLAALQSWKEDRAWASQPEPHPLVCRQCDKQMEWLGNLGTWHCRTCERAVKPADLQDAPLPAKLVQMRCPRCNSTNLSVAPEAETPYCQACGWKGPFNMLVPAKCPHCNAEDSIDATQVDDDGDGAYCQACGKDVPLPRQRMLCDECDRPITWHADPGYWDCGNCGTSTMPVMEF